MKTIGEKFMTLMTKTMSIGLIGLLLVVMGQACNQTTSGSLPETKSTGNGDYYGGLQPDDAQMSSSIESVGNSIKTMSVDSDPNPAPEPIGPGECRPLNQLPCQNGVRYEVYNDCRIPKSQATMKGPAGLKFSNPSCGLPAVGDEVKAGYGLIVTGVQGHKLYNTSGEYENYLGEKISGGRTLKRVQNGWEMSIAGTSVVLTNPNGSRIADFSQKTGAPIVFDSEPFKKLHVRSGEMIVYHNLAKLTASYTLKDVVWDSSCCHPVSGLLTLTFEGSYQGKATAQFQGCRQVRVNYGKEVRDLTLKECGSP